MRSRKGFSVSATSESIEKVRLATEAIFTFDREREKEKKKNHMNGF